MKPNDTITALPWKIDKYGHVHRVGGKGDWRDAVVFQGLTLAGSQDAEAEANTRYLVRACNALPACIQAMEHFMIDWRDFEFDYEDSPLGQTAKKIKAALALARGEKGKP